MTTQRPHGPVAVFPTADAAFARHTSTLLERRAFATPHELEAGLQTLYPSAAVREQSEFGTLAGAPKWYVFRDGGVYPAEQDLRSHDDELAHYAVDEHGTIREANAAADALYGVPRGRLVGRTVQEFGAPDLISDVVRVWRDLVDGGELGDAPVESTLLLHRPDSTVCSIRYRIRYDPAAALYRFVARRIAVEPPAPVLAAPTAVHSGSAAGRSQGRRPSA